MFDSNLDRPLIGGEAIGRTAGLVDAKGKVVLNKVYYALKNGRIDADHFGRQWVSTPRRVLSAFTGGAK
jgi:hypothetical protein